MSSRDTVGEGPARASAAIRSGASPQVPAGEERLVKGSHVIAAETWVDSQLGNGAFKSITQKSGEQWRIILPVAWYEIDVLHSALEIVSRRVGLNIEDITTEIARLNAESDLRSIYKVFLRIAQPQRVLSMTPRLWTTYVRFGSARAVKNEDGHYIGQGDGFDERLIGWGCGCWRGFIPATISVAGGRVAESRIIKRWQQSDGTYSVQFEVIYN